MSDAPSPRPRRRRGFKLRRLPLLQWPVYVAFRTAVAVVEIVSYPMARTIGRLAGRLFFHLDGRHRRVAIANLRAAEGICRDERQARRLARKVFEHLGLMTVETLLIPKRMARGELERCIELEGFEHLDAALKRGKGVVLATGHLGNWELAGLAVAQAGYDLRSIARPIENPWIDAYVTRVRRSTGQKILFKHEAVRPMVQCLRENGILVILGDQSARKNGVLVPFLGRPASTVRSTALMALKFGAAVIPLYAVRTGRDSHKIIATPPVEPPDVADREEAIAVMTAEIARRFGEFVKAHPDQWLWMHDRWKTRRPEPAAAGAGAR